jgi:hypothetical protein
MKIMSKGLSYYKFGSYYEQLKSRQDEKGASIPPDALGLETRNAQECMLMVIDDYPYWFDDVPNDFRDSNIYKKIKFYSGTPSTQERIRNQNHSEVSFLNGLEKVDSLESTGLEELKKHLIQPAQTIYLSGFMGSGKTMLAEVSAEIFDDEYENSDVASNLETIEDAETIKDFPSLNEWLDFESDASNSQEKLFIFDEAGSHATSLTGKQQAQTYNMLLPLIKQIRKARGRIILIGQSGMDLAKDIRRLAIKIEKESEKRATVFGRGEDASRLFSLYNIPLPSESYRHDSEREEYADWSWELDDDETLDIEQSTKDAIIRDIYEQVDSYRIVSEIDSDIINIPDSKQGVKKAVERAI